MNQLDLFLGGGILLFALGGLFGGAVRRVIQIAALIIAFREAWRIAPWIESLFGGGDGQSIGGWGFIIPLISFALVYMAIRMVGSWFSSLTKGTFLFVLDRIIGLALGLLVGVYLLGYGCLLIEGIFPTVPYDAASDTPPSARQSSYLYPRLISSVDDIRRVKTTLFGGDEAQDSVPVTPEPVLPATPAPEPAKPRTTAPKGSSPATRPAKQKAPASRSHKPSTPASHTSKPTRK